MNYVDIGKQGIKGSAVALGCMRIADMETAKVSKLIGASMEAGINFFDHADIYGGGKSEEVFSKAIGMSSSVREKMILQSKCAIRKGCYDFSQKHIITSVDGILKRLNTEYLDILLLHRPDTMMEPDEVACAFNKLESEGKVRHFGVSNHNPMQIELLNTAVKQPIIANQLQLSLAHTGMIDSGINVNMKTDGSVDRDGSILEYCRIKNITIQSWSSLQYGFFEGTFIDNDKYVELNNILDKIAKEQNVTKAAVAIAWIISHPAKMQAIVGSTNVERVVQMSKACDVKISRELWYEIYLSAGNLLP